MAQTIQFRRGNEANLPDLAQGEPAITLDTNKMFIGTPNGNIEVLADGAGLTNRVTEVESSLAEMVTYVSPTGTQDDTSFLQGILNNNENVVFKAGIYYIDPLANLYVPSNRILTWEKGAIFQAKTVSSGSYMILQMGAVENIELHSPYIVGERSTHTGSTGEHGHGLVVGVGCKNIQIYNPICKDCWGDGITIYGGEDIYINNVKCDNNRRQGITITNVINLTVDGAVLTNTNGVDPQAGIDIEPNSTTDEIKGIFLKNIITKSNAGSGISINLQALSNMNKNIDITIENHKDYGSNNSIYITNLREGTGLLNGTITIKEPYSQDARGNGIYVVNYGARKTPSLKIIRPTVINSNVGGQVSSKYGSGISISRETANPDTFLMGNFTIIEPTIIDNRATTTMVNGISVVDEKNVGYENARILNPLKIEGFPNLTKIKCFASGITFRDNLQVVTYAYSAPIGTSPTIGAFCLSTVINTGASVRMNWNLNPGIFIDCPITFKNDTPQGTRIIPTGATVLPLSSVAGKYLETTQIGASITLRQKALNVFVIESMIGTWTVEP